MYTINNQIKTFLLTIVIIICLYIEGKHCGIFPGNHYGKVELEDLPLSIRADEHASEQMFCHGAEQSPIDLTLKAIQANATMAGNSIPEVELNLQNYDKTVRFFIENVQNSVQVEIPKTKMTISGSALNSSTDSYDLVQFHLHWGEINDIGSEHTLDGKFFSLELHLVHMRSNYTNIKDALAQTEDRLALLVIGIFIQADDNNPHHLEFDNVVKSLRCVNSTMAGVKHTNPKYSRIQLSNLFPKSDTDGSLEILTYHGSLTSHDCNEVVNWMVFTKQIDISTAQVKPFRQMLNSKKGRLVTPGDVHNLRPIQSLNNRTVNLKKVRMIHTQV